LGKILPLHVLALILVIGIVSASLVIYYETRESRIEQMTTEQVMKMLPQSVTGFTYCDLQTMRGIAEVQEWYNNIVSSFSYVIDPNSIDYIIDAGDLSILGGKFNLENIRKVCENYTTEEYEGYQIFGYTGYVTSPRSISQASSTQNYNWGLMLMEDKIVDGDIETVRDFIDVLKGDNVSMYENSAYDEIKSEITGGLVIHAGRSIVTRYGEKIRGYSIAQGNPYHMDNIVINTARAKAVYVYDNESAAADALQKIENEIRDYWRFENENAVEQKGKTIVVTIAASPMQGIDWLHSWLSGAAAPGVGVELTFQNCVSWDAVREDNGNITVNYHDTTGNTISANVKIENLADQIENEATFDNTQTFSFMWTGAENSVPYRVILTVQHDIFGEVSENKLV
jgi:hypothetical protein